MKLTPVWLSLALLLPRLAFAWETTDAVWRAQAWLGPEVASQVVRIQNRAQGTTRYPAEFHGLVIAAADVLWFYTEFDGTQNLSLRRGQVEADAANLPALLRAVEPGLVALDLPSPPAVLSRFPERVPNSCFLACLARWRELCRDAVQPERVRLIACFPADRPTGHMLLEYTRGGVRFVFDPDRPQRAIRVGRSVADDPLAVAAAALARHWPGAPVRATGLKLEVTKPGAEAKLIALDRALPVPGAGKSVAACRSGAAVERQVSAPLTGAGS